VPPICTLPVSTVAGPLLADRRRRPLPPPPCSPLTVKRCWPPPAQGFLPEPLFSSQGARPRPPRTPPPPCPAVGIRASRDLPHRHCAHAVFPVSGERHPRLIFPPPCHALTFLSPSYRCRTPLPLSPATGLHRCLRTLSSRCLYLPSPSTVFLGEPLPPPPCLVRSPSSWGACTATADTPRPPTRPRRPGATLARWPHRARVLCHASWHGSAVPLCHWARPKAGSHGPQCGPALNAWVFNYHFCLLFQKFE
jgi:hypothetical protein